jgi:TetR/AcrR family transcriptional repressor of lmrAB and yxaGH operons
MSRAAATRPEIIPALAEIFREHGYEGASLTLIADATGLGKGSLYHFFPGGKEEMAAAVLDAIDGWFHDNVFSPLRDEPDPRLAICRMLDAVDTYFLSGRRICLVGALALGDARDLFAERVHGYFAEWTRALADALARTGRAPAAAAALAEEAVAGIQGALVLARALEDARVFSRSLGRIKLRLEA